MDESGGRRVFSFILLIFLYAIDYLDRLIGWITRRTDSEDADLGDFST